MFCSIQLDGCDCCKMPGIDPVCLRQKCIQCFFGTGAVVRLVVTLGQFFANSWFWAAVASEESCDADEWTESRLPSSDKVSGYSLTQRSYLSDEFAGFFYAANL